MIPGIIQQWETNKHKLEEYFRTTNQSEYNSYKSIVEKIFELCIPVANEYYNFNVKSLFEIDHGDYQGTKIFLIPVDTYQPGIDGYAFTHTYYGSCSGCDTLQAICDYEYGIPTEKQVKDYMTLALHLVQKLRWLSPE